MKIPISKPYITEDEIQNVIKPLKSGWLVQGPFVKELEQKFCDYTESKYAVAMNSCTSTQFIASRCINIEPDDEVIVPAFTWISTANSAEAFGAKIVFADISLDTWNIDDNLIENLISKKTKAIYPVNLFGLPANLDKIKKICVNYNLKMIEDCACSLGGFIDNKHTGLFGDCGCFSMHPRKSITTGEGGILITNDDKIAELAQSLRDHGSSKTDFERHSASDGYLLPEYRYLGYNYRLSDVLAAIGVAQFEKLEYVLKHKKEIADFYNKELKDLEFLQIPYVPENYKSGWQSYVCLFEPKKVKQILSNKADFVEKVMELNKKRNKLMYKLNEQGIATRQGTHCVSIQTYYKEKYKLKPIDLPKSFIADKLSISLPIYPQLTLEELSYIVKKIKELGMKICAE